MVAAVSGAGISPMPTVGPLPGHPVPATPDELRFQDLERRVRELEAGHSTSTMGLYSFPFPLNLSLL